MTLKKFFIDDTKKVLNGDTEEFHNDGSKKVP